MLSRNELHTGIQVLHIASSRFNPRIIRSVRHRLVLGWWLLGPVLALCAWLPTLTVYFTGEDFVFIHFAASAQPFYKPTQNLFYRPFPNLLWQLDYWLFGLHAWGYHLTNLLLHVANVALVGWLAYRLTASASTAALAASLFALQPIHIEPITWIAGRPDLSATFFGLLALICWLQGGRTYYLLTLLAFAAALFCKESVVGLPLILFGWAWCRQSEKSKKLIFKLIPYGLIIALYLAVRLTVLGGFGGYTSDGNILLNSLWNATFGLWLPLLFPVNLDSTGWLVGTGLVAALLGFYGWLLWRLRRRFPTQRAALGGGLVLMYGAILPVLNLPPVLPDLEQSRLLYLPSVGFCLLLAICLRAAYNKVVLAGLGAVYGLALGLALLSWWQAGQLVDTTFGSLQSINLPIAVGDTLYYAGLPDNWHGAYVWRNGISEATTLLLKPGLRGLLLTSQTGTGNRKSWYVHYILNQPTFGPALQLVFYSSSP